MCDNTRTILWGLMPSMRTLTYVTLIQALTTVTIFINFSENASNFSFQYVLRIYMRKWTLYKLQLLFSVE